MSTAKNRGFGALRTKPKAEPASGIAKRFGLDEDEIVAEAIANGQVREIDKSLVSADPAQPRKHFIQEKHENLKASIQENGLLQPIIVRDKANPEEGVFIIAGERRWRAVMDLPDMATIEAIVRNDIAPEKILMVQLIENVQREDMTPLEIANAFSHAIKQQGISQKELGIQLGMSESLVSTYLSMLKAPASIQDAANSRDIKDVTLLAKLSRLAKTNPEEAEQLVAKVGSGELASAEARVLTNDALKKSKGRDGASERPEKAGAASKIVTRLEAVKFSWLSGSDEAIVQLETNHGLYEISFNGSIEEVIADLQANAEGRAG